MPASLAALAELVGGRITGDATRPISGANTLDSATVEDISLLDSAEKAHRLARSQAAAVVVPADFQAVDRPAIHVGDVHAAFAKIVQYFRPERNVSKVGLSPRAFVGSGAKIASDATIRPGATI